MPEHVAANATGEADRLPETGCFSLKAPNFVSSAPGRPIHAAAGDGGSDPPVPPGTPPEFPDPDKPPPIEEPPGPIPVPPDEQPPPLVAISRAAAARSRIFGNAFPHAAIVGNSCGFAHSVAH
jgi:hypothetical protein